MNPAYLDERGRLRVVITGLGAVTPLGHTARQTWESAVAGRSGIDTVTQFDASGLPCRIAGEVRGFDPGKYMNFKEARRMARASQLAVAAGVLALEDAGLPSPLPDGERAGVIIGTGMGGFERADENLALYREKGLARANPFALVSALPNMPSHHVSTLAGAVGPISTVAAACATGVQAIGEGADLIRRGRAERVLAGGVEGLVHEATLAGFAAMRALSTAFNDEPHRACRPFDRDRDGFILSEGAVVVVLERLDLAVARGAEIYAEYLGYASSSDAYHVAAPDPDARGAIRVMRWALDDAGTNLTDVDYINAHGSSTPVNDALETMAIKHVFGEHAYNIPVSSTKSVSGHLLGGAGAIETLFCTMALREGVIPPTINYETPDPDCDLDYVPNVAREAPLRYAMNNSFGLGGQNACMVLRRFSLNGNR